MLPVELHKRTYIILSMVITIPMLFYAWIDTCHTKRILILEKEKQLTLIVNTLDQKLSRSYNALLAEENAVNASPEIKSSILHNRLQHIVDEVAQQYPGFGMGFYHPEHRIVAVAPFNSDLLGEQAHPDSLNVYNSKAITLNWLDTGITRQGKPLLAMNYPLIYDGVMIGHAWANITMDDVAAEVNYIIARNLTAIIVVWLVIISIIRWAFKRIAKSLAECTNQILTQHLSPGKFTEFPQLIPVVQTVISLRENLRQEYAERAKVNNEIAKLDRLNLVSQMAASVAHEIRNPMTVIAGYVQMTAQKADEKFRHQLDIVLEELQRVDDIISNFLSLARNKPLEMSKHQINDIILSLYPLLYADAMPRSIEIILDLAKTLPEINCDKKELSQLILNLCRNAFEAMENKGKLSITTLSAPEYVELWIADTGCGISAATAEKIFDPFFTTKTNGTGIGLAVCKSIVEQHGGKISVNSREGAGTTFIISFPLSK